MQQYFVLLLILTGSVGGAFIVHRLLSRFKNQRDTDWQREIGWKGWLASICLGVIVVSIWTNVADKLVQPLRGKMTAAPLKVGLGAVYENYTFPVLCASGLMAFLAIASQLLPSPDGQWKFIHGTRRVVAILSWIMALFYFVASLLPQ
ncbi:hypothetical protein [Bythopirellula polymerisocia]|uniref:Uncharacterized protein n=1 Tax=Bythopirellula polymerisocia TaxID=2528003 RepID=A0A5C6CYQ8_9BACT|nr:hypothetical protein [Bythopirellula polymerisocia]TWU28611.1 hypothetical protein Pla144_19030 [Bythopirellula polymerisocia]